MPKAWLASFITVKLKFRLAIFLLVLSSLCFNNAQTKAFAATNELVTNSTSLQSSNNEVVARGVPNRLLRALTNFRPRIIKVGNSQFSLGRNSLRHILTRHHPDYWDGSRRTTQTFFRRNMTLNEIENAIESVANQNRERLSRLGAGTDTVEGVVDGIRYVLRIDKGRIGSFYPRP